MNFDREHELLLEKELDNVNAESNMVKRELVESSQIMKSYMNI